MEDLDGTAGSRESLDLQVREALAPRPEAIERIVSRALAESRRAPAGRWVPVISALATLLAAATLSVLVLVPQGTRRATISIENVGELLIVSSREGGRLFIHNGTSSGSSSPSGSMIVVYGGKR